MMNKFDSVVWRLNGVILLLCSIGMVLFIAYLAIDGLLDRGARRDTVEPEKAAVVVQHEDEELVLTLGRFAELKDTEYLIAPFQHTEEYRSFKGSGKTTVFNYRFLNRETLQQSWLRENHDVEIVSLAVVNDEGIEAYSSQPKAAKKLLYTFKEDGKLSLWLSSVDGTGLKRIAGDFDEVLQKHATDAKELLVIVRGEHGKQVLKIDLELGLVKQTEALD